MRAFILTSLAAAVAISAPAMAQSPRDLLTKAAFSSPNKATALAQITQAIRGADAVLARDPGNHEAKLQRAIAIGYRGKLNRSRSDVAAARKGFEAAVAANPRDPEAHAALGGWHVSAVEELGSLIARTGLGARKAAGIASLDRAIALGGNRAFFPAYASLARIQIEPSNIPVARALAERALKSRAITAIDRIMQQRAAAILTPLKAGNGKAAAALADRLMPFGRLK